jgi:RhoGAP domain/LIM domain
MGANPHFGVGEALSHTNGQYRNTTLQDSDDDAHYEGDARYSTDSRHGRSREPEGRRAAGSRSRSRTNGVVDHKSSSGLLRTCKKCGEGLTGQFVRALNGTFHLDCFKCRDCGQIVASKFFPVDDEDGAGPYPLCETDYFRRLDLLCYECHGALRGSYITALDRKYHIEHFTCSVCPIVFGAQDSYYEHDGKVYCHYHYSTQFAQRCNGCQTAILKQFVEIFRNGANQHWHPECYMIHKFWNVRLSLTGAPAEPTSLDADVSEAERESVREDEEKMEAKVYRIWSILSTFEESSAACISDMLLHVSNGAYVDGVLVARKFIWHVDILFGATDRLADMIARAYLKELAYGREAKLLCKKIVAFFTLLSKTQDTGVRKLGVTQELLSLVTGLAHYLKLLIRIGLQGALKLEREKQSAAGLHRFLSELEDLESLKEQETKPLDLNDSNMDLAHAESDCCFACREPIDDECVLLNGRRWHLKPSHLVCGSCQRDIANDTADGAFSEKTGKVYCSRHSSRIQDAIPGFTHVTKLQQYVFLLRVALARLLQVLKSGGTLPHTSDDPNLNPYEANEGHRVSQSGEFSAPHQRVNSRSRSYAGAFREPQAESSLEQTVGEMKRLRSTRNERTLSTAFRKSRASRILDGPNGIRPGSAGADGSDAKQFQIIEERDVDGKTRPELTFGNQDALTLDDIPRIVAAEQAKEQRPNAYRHARENLFASGDPAPKLVNGHRRPTSIGPTELLAGDTSTMRTKRFFSELSALEYFIVRHLAILCMEPLLNDYFDLEELLALIDTKSKASFWDKIGKAFKADGKTKKKGTFGVPLETLLGNQGADSTHGIGPGALRVPVLLDDSVSAMRQMDMSVEGVFRKNGNIKRLKDMADQIDANQSPDLSRENPVQIAALLKKFLREMPDPLLTFRLHKLFVTSQKIDEDKRNHVLHLTCCLLPKAHRDTMEVLFAFLKWVSSFAHIDDESGSKMDSHNLATVMAPNVLYTNAKNPTVDDSFLAIEAINLLIKSNETFSEVSSRPIPFDEPGNC